MGHGTRMRVAAGAIAASAILAGAGCGGDDKPSAEEAAGAAAAEFVAAIEGAEFGAACDALTDDLADQLGGEQCSEQLGQVAGEGGEVSIEITNVRVSGPKAVAETEVRRAGEGPTESSFDLVETGKTWEVSGLGD